MSAGTAVEAPAPPSITVHLEAEAKIEASVDIAAWFNAMPVAERKNYIRFDPATHGDFLEACQPWEKPLRYLEAELMDLAEVSSGLGGRPGIARDDSEVTEWEPPRVTTGERYRSAWAEQDYALLCAQVPWLAALDRHPEDAMEVARALPGPLDRPLFNAPEDLR